LLIFMPVKLLCDVRINIQIMDTNDVNNNNYINPRAKMKHETQITVFEI
jgi:hypothetical protein